MSKTALKTSVKKLEWVDVLEHVYESRIDAVGLNERVASLATRSIKKDSKLEALNMIVSMCDLTTLEGGHMGLISSAARLPLLLTL